MQQICVIKGTFSLLRILLVIDINFYMIIILTQTETFHKILYRV